MKNKNKNNDTKIASVVETWKVLSSLSAEQRLEFLEKNPFTSLSVEQRLEVIKCVPNDVASALLMELSEKDRELLQEVRRYEYLEAMKLSNPNFYKDEKKAAVKREDNQKKGLSEADYPQSIVKVAQMPLPRQEVVHLKRNPYKVLQRDTKGNFIVDNIEITKDTLRQLKSDLLLIMKEIASVTKDGYVHDINLSTFPILCDYLPTYVNLKGGENEGINSIESKFTLGDYEKKLTLRERRILMAWLYRLLNLNLYTLTLHIVSKLKTLNVEDILDSSGVPIDEESLIDIVADLENLSKIYYGKINPSIREAMRQKSITITKNIYSGFDTEYDNVDMKHNRLLSAQWAVNSKVLLTLPDVKVYSLSNMNTHSGEEYAINSMWYDQSKILFGALEQEVVENLSIIRNIKGFTSNDQALKNLKERLISMGLPYFISNGKVTFSFERSITKTYFKATGLDKLNMEKLVSIGQNLGSADVDQREKEVRSLLKDYNIDLVVADAELPESDFTNLKAGTIETTEVLESTAEKELEKSWKSDASQNKLWRGESSKPINLIIRRNFNLIGHLTQADISLLADFDELKNNFDIINKNLVTLGDTKLKYNGYKLKLYDTMLLAPGGRKSLASIGAIYGFPKLELSQAQYENMSKLLKENPELFKEYALRDAVISLIHAQRLEDAHFKLHKASIPLTLSLLGGANLRKSWEDKGYTGYQISKEVMLGDSRQNSTPKGLFHLGETGLVLNNYVSNYKGGRNESFMVGTDNGATTWYDYDLTAAYTSAMCMLGNPNYDLVRNLTREEILDMSEKELIYSYTIIKVNFEFPEGTAYPSIPCFADNSTTIYPLKGKAQLTGAEYLLAKSQNCVLNIEGGTIIPYTYKSRSRWEDILKGNEAMGINATVDKKLKVRIEKLLSRPLVGGNVSTVSVVTDWEQYKYRAFPPRELFNVNKFSSLYMDLPFSEIVSDLQKKRGEHRKGTLENLLYKEMGNSLYGSVAKGISNKMRYDIKTNKTVRMEAGSISNPIMASYITAAVRSLIGIFLQEVAVSGGKAVSVTTDGLISDQESLETKFQTNLENVEEKVESSAIYKAFSEVRKELSGKGTLLELKHRGENLTSWTTRGQISSGMLAISDDGLPIAGSGLRAATGLQTQGLDFQEVEALIKEGLSSETKTVSYVSTSLRSIKEIVQKGGHVTMVYRDQDFRLHYNNNREIIGLDATTGFMNTKPWLTIEEALSARLKANLIKGSLYQRNTSLKSTSKYKSFLELGIRHFIKYIFVKGYFEAVFNSSYQNLLDFIKVFMFESGLEFKSMITIAYISEIRIKMMGKVLAPNRFILSKENRLFYDYVVKTLGDYRFAVSTKNLQSRL